MNFTERQITFDNSGHIIHNYQVFSPDDEWIVFDSRNVETEISSTGTVSIVKVNTGEIKELYRTKNQTVHGPGVGAVTFSPVEDKVLFIHGIRNASASNPYGFARRTGVAIDINDPHVPIFMDARNIIAPFTPGALRGGTHAHTWSGDGKWISFTYNDYVFQQRSIKDSSVRDLRTIGVMVPGRVTVPEHGVENNDGEMFSALVVPVKENPTPGSDEIDRAFDEGWIGKEGYLKADGSRQKKAIAFQGNTRNVKGDTITEVFVVDLPDDIIQAAKGKAIQGTDSTRPGIPNGVHSRRITFTKNGLAGPRFWLRSSPDGSVIAYLAKDTNDIVQIYLVSPNGGQVRQLTFHSSSIQGPFNFSPDGHYLAYTCDNSIFVTNILDGKSYRVTMRRSEKEKPVGAPVWSNHGSMIAYNRYVKSGDNYFAQIFVLKKED